MNTYKSLLLVIASFLFGLFGVYTAQLVSAHGGDTTLVHSCVRNTNGAIRIVRATMTCNAGETAVDWRIQGEPGPAGPAGPKGDKGDPGPQGIQGVQGPAGPQGQVGADGFHCWDLNQNRLADPNEDVNGDSVVNVFDCTGPQGVPGSQGSQGPPGLPCWDLNGNGVPDLPAEDTNGDGQVNVLDCKGPKGDQGQQGPKGDKGDKGDSGVNCWDLNGNGVPDVPTEDTNGDGQVNVADCKGEKGDQGPPGLITLVPRNSFENFSGLACLTNDNITVDVSPLVPPNTTKILVKISGFTKDPGYLLLGAPGCTTMFCAWIEVRAQGDLDGDREDTFEILELNPARQFQYRRECDPTAPNQYQFELLGYF